MKLSLKLPSCLELDAFLCAAWSTDSSVRFIPWTLLPPGQRSPNSLCFVIRDATKFKSLDWSYLAIGFLNRSSLSLLSYHLYGHILHLTVLYFYVRSGRRQGDAKGLEYVSLV